MLTCAHLGVAWQKKKYFLFFGIDFFFKLDGDDIKKRKRKEHEVIVVVVVGEVR